MAEYLPKTTLIHEIVEEGLDDIIDDGSTDTTTTWSSSKINSDKQETLVSATNIKTINSNSILGSGDLVIHRGVMIYNQMTEPTDQEDGDIWVVRQPI